MSQNNTGYSGGGMGFVSGLQLLFIGLKLGGVINWSWWVVFLPFIISGSIVGLILMVALIFFVFAMMFNK